MAVLGLLQERPDSASRVQVRLEQAYPQGRWAPSTNYAIFLELTERGAVKKIRAGSTPPDDLYATTLSGTNEFDEYLRVSVEAPPRIRDPMYAWIKHSTEAELPEMIQATLKMQARWRAEYERVQELLKTEQRLGNLGSSDGSDWQGRVRYTILKDMLKRCAQQVERYMSLCALLENQETHLEDQEVGGG
jgi:hypothetical protein